MPDRRTLQSGTCLGLVGADGNILRPSKPTASSPPLVTDLPLIEPGALDLPPGVEARLWEAEGEIVLWDPKRRRHICVPIVGHREALPTAVAMLRPQVVT